MIKKNYLNYIHILRGLAILIIIAIHSRMALFGGTDVSPLNKELIIFLDNGTIIFVIIAGFLFHHVFIPKFNFRTYFLNKSRYVLLPYILVSILPIIDKLFFDDNIPWLTSELAQLNSAEFVIYMLISGKHFGPFWFIPMIAIFYLIAPALKKLNVRIFYRYIFPVIFIGGLFSYQFGYYSTILNSFIFYLPIYLFGMLLSEYKSELFKYQKLVLPSLLILYVGITILELMELIKSPKLIGFSNFDTLYFIFNPAKLRFSVLTVILLILFYNLEFFKFRLFRILGDYSFGIYFVHLFFIILIQKTVKYYQVELPKSLITFLIFVFFTTSFSIMLVWVIKAIFKNKSRFLIGS